MSFDWLKSLGDFIRSWAGAFSFFGGAATAIWGRRAGYLASDVEFVVGFIGASAFWMMIALAIAGARKKVRTIRTARRIKATGETASREREERKIEERARALENLKQLLDWEREALRWIYHKGGRARASINHTGIDGLVNLRILHPESYKAADWTDTIWIIPHEFIEALERMFGPADPDRAKTNPPWEKRW